MKYELKSVYLEDEEVFAFKVTNIYKGEYFEWMVSDVTKERFLLLSNDIIVKATFDKKNENFIYELIRGNGTDLKEKFIETQPTNIFEFESDDEEISVRYDFYQFPNTNREIAGKIIGDFIFQNDGGFFEDEEDYELMENDIVNILDKYYPDIENLVLTAKVGVKDDEQPKKTTSRKKPTNSKKTDEKKTTTKKSTTRKNNEVKDVE